MKILIACEESQTICKAFRELWHEAYSCDILECSWGHPEWHILGDAVEVAYREHWDMMIAHPPCTHIAVSWARHFEQKRKDWRQKEAIDFFMKLANAPIERIAIENPVCIMSSIWRKPDQTIQPWMFWDQAQKTTCLWLKNLPKLQETDIVWKWEFYISPSGKKLPKWYNETTIKWDRQKSRSKTFPWIAKAIAEQWVK